MKPIGHTLIRLEEAASTNTLAMETPAYLENHGLVLCAHHQTAGRGRVGRAWVSLPGTQLQFSVVLHPPLPSEQVPVLSLLSALAVGTALSSSLGLQPELRWPNDVFLEGKKVCGILVEMKRGPGGRPRVVTGIGVNCLGGPEDFPPHVRGLLTTVAHQARRAGREFGGMEPLLREILAALQSCFERLVGGGQAALLEEWERMGRLAGARLEYPTPEGPRPGRALGLTGEGHLLIETAGGGRHVHLSGDLRWTPEG